MFSNPKLFPEIASAVIVLKRQVLSSLNWKYKFLYKFDNAYKILLFIMILYSWNRLKNVAFAADLNTIDRMRLGRDINDYVRHTRPKCLLNPPPNNNMFRTDCGFSQIPISLGKLLGWKSTVRSGYSVVGSDKPQSALNGISIRSNELPPKTSLRHWRVNIATRPWPWSPVFFSFFLKFSRTNKHKSQWHYRMHWNIVSTRLNKNVICIFEITKI